MKTKLSLAICAGLVLSTASMAALANGQSNPEQQTVQTTKTTTTTSKHIPGTRDGLNKQLSTGRPDACKYVQRIRSEISQIW